MSKPETIFALATAPGRAAVAVVRVSGSDSDRVLSALAGRLPPPRKASVRKLRSEGRLIDEALVLRFTAPHSYTGEDAAEFHLHGGVAVVEALSEALLTLGLRPAEPGEFTRRAFENGKLDLAQAEGVADLIDAETTAQARQALDQIGGALSARHESWRAALLEALAFFEAAVDFPDEEVPPEVELAARRPLTELAGELARALAADPRGRQIREGFKVALIGAPNAGKSSLFNAIVGREAAIVTSTPGTTRDVIEASLTLGGYRVLLADTAGMRETGEAVEAEGVRRANAWAAEADRRVLVVDGSDDAGDWATAATQLKPGDFIVAAKADLDAGPDHGAARALADGSKCFFHAVSVRDPASVSALLDTLESHVVRSLAGSEFPPMTRARHAVAMNEARNRIAAALLAPEPELAAEDVRLAARALGRIAGRIDAEQVLDLVFGKFCIGK